MRKSLQFALAAGSTFIFASAAMAQDATVRLRSAVPGPTADGSGARKRVRAILGTTLDELARAGFPAHMGRASSCAVHFGGARALDRASKPD